MLRHFGRQALAENYQVNGASYDGISKLEMLLGKDVWREAQEKVVIDYGCGPRKEAVDIARHGARHVIGIDTMNAHAGLSSTYTHAQRYLADSLRELWVRPTRQVPALDAVRAVAVLAVILAHFFTIFWTENMNLPVPPMADGAVFYYGWTGVDLFFILSGYLIGVQLWREKKRTGTIRIWEFIVRRGFRIWPLYYTMILLGMLAGVLRPSLSDLLFFSNYVQAEYHRGWTLSTEEQFYIAVPLLLAFTPGITKLHRYFWILGSVVVSVWVARYYTCESILETGVASCKELNAMITPFHVHNESLVAGLAIALLSVLRPEYFERKPADRFSWRGFAVLAVSCTIAAVLYSINRMIFTFTAMALIYGSVTLWLLWDRSLFSRPAAWRIWYPISRLSYGMYLNHFFLLSGATAWVVTRVVDVTGSTTLGSYAGIVAGIVVSMLFAVVTFVCVERPFLLLRARWVAARATAIPPDRKATSTDGVGTTGCINGPGLAGPCPAPPDLSSRS